MTSLESRLQELSETVRMYDRLRAHDQQEIAKLKNRDGTCLVNASTIECNHPTCIHQG